MARTGDLQETLAVLHVVRIPTLAVSFQEPAQATASLLAAPAFDQTAVQVPDHLVAGSGRAVGVLLELPQQVVQEGRFAATRRAVEEVDLVLLGAAAQAVDHGHQTVGEEAVGEERLIRTIDQQGGEIEADEIDGFGIPGVLVDTLAHEGLDHVMEDLVDVADRPCGMPAHQDEELIEGNGPLLILDLLAARQILHDPAHLVHAKPPPCPACGPS